MFTVIFTIVSVFAIVSAAAAGYLFATIKAMKAAAVQAPTPVVETPAAVPSPEAQPVEADAPVTVAPVETPAAAAPEPTKEAEEKPAPKRTRKPSEASTEPKVKKESLPLPEGAPAKPVRSDYADSDAYKAACHAYWNKITALRRKMAKGGNVATVKSEKPVATKATEEKPAPAPVKNEEKPAAPAPAAPVADKPAALSKPVTEHTKAELLEAIKKFDKVLIEAAAIDVKIGKSLLRVKEVNSTAALMTDGKEYKLTAVPFSKAILENIIVACSEAVKAKDEKTADKPATNKRTSKNDKKEQPADAPATPSAEAPKAAPKEDVQPMTDAERYLINQASAIVTVMDNRRIESVSFTDAVKTELTNPKGQKIAAEVLGFNRHNGKVFVAFNDGKNDKAFELLKAAPRFNRETLCTLLKQINAAVANRKGANANLVPMKSVVA